MLRRLLLVLALTFVMIEPTAAQRVTLAAVGDIQLGRGVGREMEQHGVDYPFAKTSPTLKSADLTFGNLECALSKDGRLIPKRFSFKADPASAAGLARAGFDLLALANNHSVDCGRERLSESLAILNKYGLRGTGAGENMTQARAPVMVTRKGIKIAFLARTMVSVDGMVYREDVPGPAMFELEELLSDIKAAKQQADLVVISLHWGVEFTRQPQEEQRRIAHQIIDAGACLLLGHHPHTPQPLEWYHRGLIAYSLGNFVFDAVLPHSQEGVILQCILSKRGVEKAKLIKTTIDHGQPQIIVTAKGNSG